MERAGKAGKGGEGMKRAPVVILDGESPFPQGANVPSPKGAHCVDRSEGDHRVKFHTGGPVAAATV